MQSASATRQELVVAGGVDAHTVAAAERNFVVTQLHEASREPKMRLMADIMNPTKEEAVVAPTTRVLESVVEASLIHMNPEAASPHHDHVDEPADEEHEQQLLRLQRLSISSILLQLIDLPMNFIIMMRMTSTLLLLQQQLQVKILSQVVGTCN